MSLNDLGVDALTPTTAPTSPILPVPPPQIVSLNDLGVDALTPATTPYLVIVAASTGDGDPPDNASAGFLSLRRQQGSGLKGMRFTVLGLGDSNYTRFMCVSRTIKNK